MLPLISVIVPVYNMENYLERCVDSLLKQTYSNLEIFLVNDGSKDTSAIICEKYASEDSRIKVIHKENGGLSSARNAGLEKATGDYISLVDADDWMEPDAYQLLVDTVLSPEAEDPDIVRFNAYRGKEILNKPPFEGLYKGDKLRKEISFPAIGPEKLGGTFIMGTVWLDFYKREFLERENLRFIIIKRYEDRLFTVDAFLKARSIFFLNVPLYHYEYISASMSNKYDGERWTRELEYMENLKNICLQGDIPLESIKYRLRNEYLLRAVTTVHHEFFSDNPGSFLKKYRKVAAIVNNPFVKDASRDIKKHKQSRKDNLILYLIKNRYALFLSLLENSVLYVNKMRK